MTVRPARGEDAAAIARIYNQGIDAGTATFETRHRSAADIEAWIGTRFPVLVAEQEREVVGFAVSTAYSPRECYAGIAEFSIYVEAGHRRSGTGRLLMEALGEAARAAGLRKLTGKVFACNAASRALCLTSGMREVGVHLRHGEVKGRWHDVVVVEWLL